MTHARSRKMLTLLVPYLASAVAGESGDDDDGCMFGVVCDLSLSTFLSLLIAKHQLMQAIRHLDNMRWQTSTGRFVSSRRGIQRLATTTAFYYAAAQQPQSTAMAFSSSSTAANNSSPLVLALQGGFNTEQQPLPSHPHMKIHHVKQPIASTQDEARRLLLDNTPSVDEFLAVVADQQEAGRGTNGRTWESSTGNMYLTVGIPMSKIPVMLTMLPLQIAVLVAERAETILKHCASSSSSSSSSSSPTESSPHVHVKWPNDVLVDDAKLSGTLIESVIVQNESWFLIGIGINVMHAPSLAKSPGKQIRPAVSLQAYCGENLPEQTALYLGTDLAYALADWVTTNSTLPRAQANQAVLQAWKAKADFGKAYEIRSNDVAEESSDSYRGEQVVAVDIAPDGQLKIRGADGKERLLVADYFF